MEHKAAYSAACRHKHDVLDQKKRQYWSEQINNDSSSPTKLWHSMTSLLQRDRRTADDITRSGNDADACLRFFLTSRSKLFAPPQLVTNCPPLLLSPTRHCRYCHPAVRRLILQSPTKSCVLDPIPTFLLKEFVDALLPYVTAMINADLRNTVDDTGTWIH